ncbi:MAG TPA: S-layer homology domain-containing protein [Halomicronema sp.]
MYFYPRHTLYITLTGLLLLTSCANSPNSTTLQETLAPDPALTNTPNPSKTPQTPSDFPPEIPPYPEAQLQQQTPIPNGKTTRWKTTDPSNAVENFYRQKLQTNNWEIINQTNPDPNTILQAKRDNLQIKLAIETPTTNTSTTTYIIEYQKNNQTTKTQTSPTLQGKIEANIPSKPTPKPTPQTTPNQPKTNNETINTAPAQLRPYLEDLNNLNIFSNSNNSTQTTPLTEPNKTISRREFARWLLTANNKIYANQPARQIRLGIETAQPIFSDITPKDPDFAIIQGLAEAGIIPSTLTGNNTQLQFRPDTPLTRETLVLWKVPLDTRQVLPTTSIDTVQKTWGFQDTTKIEPDALKAISADYQNGDLSNIRRAFGYTTIFQPKKPVTRAEAAASLWYFGIQPEGLSAKDALQTPTPNPTQSPNN